jgi:UV DNA damage endonuclease
MVNANFRFGYACICTELRKKGIFTSRTLRLQTLQKKGIEYAKELAIKNLQDLLTTLRYNVKNNIFFMRISSQIFPFVTHPDYYYSLDFCDTLLKEIGNYANEFGIRLTMHQCHFNVLSSNKESVVINTIRDLNHHCDILDRMGIDANGVIIIHAGSKTDGKIKSLERLKENIITLPKNTRNRLSLENCEISYTVEDLLPICEELQIPLTIDFHHDDLNPSSQSVEFYFNRVFKIWENRDIKPKVHVSNSCPGILKTDTMTKRRKHSDLIEFLHEPLLTIKIPLDVMLECKLKEQAIYKLR